jgi:uncharacterized membrane protein
MFELFSVKIISAYQQQGSMCHCVSLVYGLLFMYIYKQQSINNSYATDLKSNHQDSP